MWTKRRVTATGHRERRRRSAAALGGLGRRRALRGRQALVVAPFSRIAICGPLGRQKTRRRKGVGVLDPEESPLDPVLTSPCPRRDSILGPVDPRSSPRGKAKFGQ